MHTLWTLKRHVPILWCTMQAPLENAATDRSIERIADALATIINIYEAGIMGRESSCRNHGEESWGAAMGQKSWGRNRGGIMEESRGRVMGEEAWRRNHEGRVMGKESSGRNHGEELWGGVMGQDHGGGIVGRNHGVRGGGGGKGILAPGFLAPSSLAPGSWPRGSWLPAPGFLAPGVPASWLLAWQPERRLGWMEARTSLSSAREKPDLYVDRRFIET